METMELPEVKTKDPKSRWVALDIEDNTIIAEGETPEEVITKAEKVGKDYIMSFVFDPNKRYIL